VARDRLVPGPPWRNFPIFDSWCSLGVAMQVYDFTHDGFRNFPISGYLRASLACAVSPTGLKCRSGNTTMKLASLFSSSGHSSSKKAMNEMVH
jgi:hypothetical protein